MWSEQPFERLLKQKLKKCQQGDDYLSDYGTARRFVIEEIAPYIARTEPDLTDHGDRHLAHVMERALSLIGDETDYFTPQELYLLAISILLHDVGNLHGRKEHQKKVAQIYDALRKREARFAPERNAVLAITGAHTGAAKDGSRDTLQDLGVLSFNGKSVKAQEIAAVLRLADELAEGPKRTSAYLLNHDLYSPESTVYHKYAEVVDYCIERGDGRIALSFSIDLELAPHCLEVGEGVPLKDLLQFSYERIHKLDQERRYCKFYCNLLKVFRETGAYFNYYFDGQKLELDVPALAISDLIVPGEATKSVEQIDPRYCVDDVIASLEGMCKGRAQ